MMCMADGFTCVNVAGTDGAVGIYLPPCPGASQGSQVAHRLFCASGKICMIF